MAQDAQGLLWLATDVGLLRTDGELCEKVMVAEGRTITALGARSGEVYSVWNDGTVVRCVGMRCDTLFRDSLLVRSPVRAVARDGQGDLWLATYGSGDGRA
jgi:ligand-binding sensor domain-containing protein